MSLANSKKAKDKLHVLIAGAGVVGLTIAQGCRQHGIPFTIFERDSGPNSRSQGWALTLHWSLRSLRRTIGAELSAEIPKAFVDTTLKVDEGNFLFLNAETGKVRYKIPPAKERYRLERTKFRNLLSTDIDIQWGKDIESYEETAHGVQANFKDGSSASGSLLIGADGNNSNVRKCLIPDNEKSSLSKLPVNLIGVVRHFTPEEGAPVRALDPLLFLGMHPKTSNFLWYSVQQVYEDQDGRRSWDALVIISWLVRDLEQDAIPPTNQLRIANMKERAKDFVEPLKSLVLGIPDDLENVTPLTLADFPKLDWSSNRIVTLAGDAAHAMTMYRGEGANHGILDAALLVDQLVRVSEGKVGQTQAIEKYEIEMKERCEAAVLKSRKAALDAHCWEDINDDSPLIGGRWPPATA